MFSNKKKSFLKSKLFFVCIAILVFGFGIWLNYGGQNQLVNTQTNVDQNSESTTQAPSVVDSRGDEGTSTEAQQNAYYLIREVEGVVKIFYCDEQGNESLYEITTIPFDLLSQKDQQLFVEGVHIDSEEELEGFLENFDS